MAQQTLNLNDARTLKHDKPYKHLDTSLNARMFALASLLAGDARYEPLVATLRTIAYVRPSDGQTLYAHFQALWDACEKHLTSTTVSMAAVRALNAIAVDAWAHEQKRRTAERDARKAERAEYKQAKAKSAKENRKAINTAATELDAPKPAKPSKDDVVMRRAELAATLKAALNVGTLTLYESALADLLIGKLSE